VTAPTVFGSDQTQTPTPEANTSKTGSDTTDTPLAILVGEGRKYKSVEELAKATLHLDDFAEKLKSENAQLRDEVKKAKTIDEVLQRLEQPKASTQDQGADEGRKGLTADAIAKIVDSVLTGRETAKSRYENQLKADAELKKLYGEKAGEVFAKHADTPEKKKALTELASVDPTTFVKLFSPGTQAQSTRTDTGTTVNTAALEQTNQSGRAMDSGTKEFYDAMRRKEPRKYYSQAVQAEMSKAAHANPEKFFGRKLGA
jgi:hypothetical protein